MSEHWRIGNHYGIHVYEGDRPVATFHRAEDAMVAIIAHNLVADRLIPSDCDTTPATQPDGRGD